MTTQKFDLNGYLDAIRRKDVDTVLSMYADDVLVEDVATGDQISGKDNLRSLLERMVPVMPKVDIKPDTVVMGEGSVAMLARINAVYPQDLNLPDGDALALKGKRLDVRAAVFMNLNKQGLIQRLVRVIDMQSVQQQLGISAEQMRDARSKLKDLLRPPQERPYPEQPVGPMH